MAPDQKPDDQKCVFVIFNPVSGQTDPEQRKKIISDTLAEHGYTCQFIATSKEEGARELAKKALDEGVDLLAVSGGDGTVMETMAALVGTDIPVAVLPAGTGNLLSVNLGIPMTVPEAVDVALSGDIYELDLARYDLDGSGAGEGRYFAIMGGIGLDARVIADADREAKKKLGVLAYFVAAIKNLPRRRSRVEIHLDDKPPLLQRVKTVLIANMGKITGGLEAVPTASPNDGRLDVAIMRTETLGQWLRLLGFALMGRAQDDPSYSVHQARRVSIRTTFPEPVEFDGEEVGRVRDLTVEVVPKAVRVLVPPGAPAAEDAQGPPAAQARERARRRFVAPTLLALAVLAGVWAWRRKR
ncbi:MAG: diacylglycerol kinase family lipid kinase [Armatimonadetes bacterium]|nr:diacylglycerol kinase family lipid kinase [Armatimonadota bacterium]